MRRRRREKQRIRSGFLSCAKSVKEAGYPRPPEGCSVPPPGLRRVPPPASSSPLCSGQQGRPRRGAVPGNKVAAPLPKSDAQFSLQGEQDGWYSQPPYPRSDGARQDPRRLKRLRAKSGLAIKCQSAVRGVGVVPPFLGLGPLLSLGPGRRRLNVIMTEWG